MKSLWDMNTRFIKRNPALLCALAALVFLLGYYAQIRGWSGATMSGGHNSRSYIYINGDNDLGAYMSSARGLLDGTWPDGPFFRAPLYSFFLALCLAARDSIAWCAFVQILFAAATVYLMCRAAEHLFDAETGIAASVMLMLYGGFVFITVVLHTAIMESFLASLAFYRLCLLRKDFSPRNAVLAGMSAALAGLIRPNFLLVCPLGIVFAYVEHAFGGKRFRASSSAIGFVRENCGLLMKPLPAMLAFFLLLSPFIIWNNMKSDRLVFISTNAKITWRQSNSYDSPACGIILEPAEPLMPVFSHAFWRHQISKAGHYLKSVEVPQNVSYYIFHHYSSFLKFLPLNFGLLNALFIASLFYFFRDWRKLWPVAVYTVLYAMTIVAFNITGRYRLPAVPVMLIPAAAMLLDIFRNRARELRSRRVAVSSGVFLVLLIYSAPLETADNFNSWGNQARRSMFALNLPEYHYCVSRMNRIAPVDRNVRLTLATSSAMSGDFETACVLLGVEREYYPDDEYLDATTREVGILASASSANDIGIWMDYMGSESRGHLAGQYALYLRNIEKREEYGLAVDENHKALLDRWRRQGK